MARKVYTAYESSGEHYGYTFFCPGCGCHHCYYTEKPNSVNAQWSFNGDVENPTFRASMMINTKINGKKHVCHSYVTDGKIEFLPDCTHKFAGQTIEMEDVK